MTIQQTVLNSRVNGILLPLASMKTETDWGVGDFGSLIEWIDLLSDNGVKMVQILPLQETAPHENCPYSAMTAFATDPVYTDISQVQDVAINEKAQQLMQSLQADITSWHQAEKAPFYQVKEAKLKVLWLGYQHFLQHEQQNRTARYQAFEAYCSSQSSWLRGYSLFRALKEYYNWSSWTNWPEKLRDYDKTAVDTFEAQNKEYVQFFAYVQWVLDQQLRKAKVYAESKNILIFGDIPFATNLDSAEVWAERENFRIGWEIGAPADQFSKGGQRWGLPAYDWNYQHSHNLTLWRRKIRRVTELYDVFRLDHLVGFYRTYVFAPNEQVGAFDIEGEQPQIDRGYNFLKMVQEEAQGKLAVGEDLGVIPNYVRRMLNDMQIPGYKVLRWEREDNGYYREPRNFPIVSLATTSTHDTESVRGWWETMDQRERANIWEMISAQKTDGNIPFNEYSQRAILKRVLGSNSALVMFSWQDIIGSLDRINTPGTVGENNWTYRSAYTAKQVPEIYAKQLTMYKELLQETNRN